MHTYIYKIVRVKCDKAGKNISNQNNIIQKLVLQLNLIKNKNVFNSKEKKIKE